MTAALRVRNARKRYGTVTVLDGVNLTVEKGQVVVILGPSGSGKSTLLRTINHLEKLDGGYVMLGDELMGARVQGDHLRELPESALLKQRSRIGFVFQNFNLFPHLTVLENVTEAPISSQGRKRAEAEATATRLLEQVGLGAFLKAYPRQLSGGQQQRVAIARALALEPELILFDEPTSALDVELVGEVLAVMKALAESGATLVVVTHEISFAREVADVMIFMDAGQIVEQGTPAEVLDNSQHQRTKDFLSRMR